MINLLSPYLCAVCFTYISLPDPYKDPVKVPIFTPMYPISQTRNPKIRAAKKPALRPTASRE